eukprot:Pgem_evm1s7905
MVNIDSLQKPVFNVRAQSPKNIELNEVLNDTYSPPFNLKSFQEYCASRYVTEGFEFLIAVKEFKEKLLSTHFNFLLFPYEAKVNYDEDLESIYEFVKIINNIYTNYVKKNACKEINISSFNQETATLRVKEMNILLEQLKSEKQARLERMEGLGSNNDHVKLRRKSIISAKHLLSFGSFQPLSPGEMDSSEHAIDITTEIIDAEDEH